MRVRGVPEDVSEEVRRTMRAPGHGHPAVVEVAQGRGPCRSCLGTFRVGEEERILFTFRPAQEGGTVTAPGPVFVHRERCEPHRGDGLPVTLRELPLLLEARGDAGRVLAAERTGGAAIEQDVERLLAVPGVRYLFVRNAEVGCWIARVDA